MASIFWLYGCFFSNECIGSLDIDGDWNGVVNDKYLGVKFHADAKTFYGWIRLNVISTVTGTTSNQSFTIKDYAYNSAPDKNILAGETSALPLNLLGFNGMVKNNQVVLTWSTANEINNKGFDIERSADGQNFYTIGFATAKGNASSITSYSFTDTKRSESSFYRLKQIDNDGNYKYSRIIQINFVNSDAYKIAITPNPLSNSATISFTLPQPKKVSINIFDMTGRLVKTLVDAEMQAGTHQIIWDAEDEKGNSVSEGVYILKFQTNNYSETKKLSIVRP